MQNSADKRKSQQMQVLQNKQQLPAPNLTIQPSSLDQQL